MVLGGPQLVFWVVGRLLVLSSCSRVSGRLLCQRYKHMTEVAWKALSAFVFQGVDGLWYTPYKVFIKDISSFSTGTPMRIQKNEKVLYAKLKCELRKKPMCFSHS